jgi:hypothetical protein
MTTQYTFRFPRKEERVFRSVIDRLDPDEFRVIEEIRTVDLKDGEDARYADLQSVMEMDPEAASTFRFRMGNDVKIRRQRTEEELKEEEDQLAKHKITIHVQVPTEDPKTP